METSMGSSGIISPFLDQTHTLLKLNTFKQLISSCIGPNGKLKIIQNTCDGPTMITSSCFRMFQNIAVSSHILKVIVASTKNHVETRHDFGLFTSLLCAELLISSIKLSMNRILLAELNDIFSTWVIEFLSSNAIKLKVEFDSVEPLISLVRTVLKSKSAACLNNKEMKHLPQILVQAFLRSISINGDAEINLRPMFILHEGISPIQSRLFSGVVFESKRPKTLMAGIEGARVVLFGISLSGDSEDMVEADIVSKDQWSMVDGVLTHVLSLCEQLVARRVTLVLCQKVIHPAVKKFLEDRGLLPLDRLGQAVFQQMCELSGVAPVMSLNTHIQDEHIGRLESVNHIELNGKHFWNATASGSDTNTIYLCNRNEQSLTELKVVMEQAYHALTSLIQEPYVYPGAGCLETIVAQHVLQKVAEERENISRDLEVNEFQVEAAAASFVKCLHAVARTLHCKNDDCSLDDGQNGHLWLVDKHPMTTKLNRCCCGLVDELGTNIKVRNGTGEGCEIMENKPVKWQPGAVVDVAGPRIYAYRVAFETANSLLRIGSCIVSS